MEEPKTAEKIVAETNELAREFYAMLGYNRPKSFLFYKATHPQEKLCWSMASVAMEKLRKTEIDDLLDEVLERTD